MTCKCGSTRMMLLFCKHDDRAVVNIPHMGIEYDGYMPRVGRLGGDDTEFTICMDCGQIQNWEQITDEMILDVDDRSFQRAVERSGFKLDNGDTIVFPKI